MKPRRPGRKKSKNPLSQMVFARLTLKEYNRVRTLARIYARGNLSRWIRHAVINAERRFLK